MSPRRPIVLVTGATGRLGKIVFDHLLQDGTNGEVFGTWHTKRPSGFGVDGAQWMRFELQRPEPLVSKLGGRRHAVVVHMACTMSNDMNICFPHDCLGAMRLAHALRNSTGKILVIYTSSVSAKDANTDYGLAKQFVERSLCDLRRFGVHVQVIRLPRMKVDRNEEQLRESEAERLLRLMNVSARIRKWLRAEVRHA
jgi:nucleoside-diphosphate-sugar epimerase